MTFPVARYRALFCLQPWSLAADDLSLDAGRYHLCDWGRVPIWRLRGVGCG